MNRSETKSEDEIISRCLFQLDLCALLLYMINERPPKWNPAQSGKYDSMATKQPGDGDED
jgi:hypothetical protein